MLDGLGELVDGAQAGAGDPQPGGARADDTDAGYHEEDDCELVEGAVTCSMGKATETASPGRTSGPMWTSEV